MLYYVGWNIICIHSIIPNVFSVGFLVRSVTHIITSVVPSQAKVRHIEAFPQSR